MIGLLLKSLKKIKKIKIAIFRPIFPSCAPINNFCIHEFLIILAVKYGNFIYGSMNLSLLLRRQKECRHFECRQNDLSTSRCRQCECRQFGVDKLSCRQSDCRHFDRDPVVP